MAFDFEALVGHLYIVGGRSISATPPGTLVEVAPRKAARGRELDTIFVLVTPSGQAAAPGTFYDQMANLAAERYFSSSGSVTAGLRTVFNTLNQDLNEHNHSGKRQYEANILCAVLRDNEVFLGRVGSSVAVIINQSQAEPQPFPTEFSNDEALFGPPLGVHPVPTTKMSRYTIQPGSRLVMADARLADNNFVKTVEALRAPNISEVLQRFKEQTATQITLLASEFVTPEAPSPIPVKEGHSTARSVAPPPPVETSSPETVVPSQEIKPSRRRGSSPAQRSAGRLALGLAGVLEGINHLLDRIFPRPTEGKRPWLKASTLAAITILVPIGIVLLVMVMGLGRTGESEFELCVDEANKSADVARSVASSDVNGTVSAWNAVITVVDGCNDLRAGDPSLAALTREGQTVIDKLSQVERRDTTVITSLPNAVLTQAVLQGLNLYVLDSQNEQVYQISLTEDGRNMVPDGSRPIPSMRLNASVNEFRVGNLIDIAWADDITQIVALDDNGLFIQCSPRFLQTCEAQQLLGAERWQHPTRITLWQGRLYILDPAANQIWRYDSSGGTYATVPAEYFSGNNRTDISNAVDFGIDDRGSVYLLAATGEITKWVSGEQNAFVFAGFPSGQQILSADAMFLDTNPVGQAIYIVSRNSLTVYETTLAGSFLNSYRSFNEDHFAALANVVADANQQLAYVLSGNSVFLLDKQAAPTS